MAKNYISEEEVFGSSPTYLSDEEVFGTSASATGKNSDSVSNPFLEEKSAAAPPVKTNEPRGLLDRVGDFFKSAPDSVMEGYVPSEKELAADVSKRLSYGAGPILPSVVQEASAVKDGTAQSNKPIVNRVAKEMRRRGEETINEKAARFRAEDQDRINEEALRDNRRKFAEDNPILGSLASGAASQTAGLINSPSVVADFFNQSVVNPVLEVAGLPKLERTSTMFGTEYLTKGAADFMPKIGRKDMGKAYDQGEFGLWLMSKVASNSPQMATSLAAAFVPPLRAALLPTMGATSAGSSFVEGDDSRVAAAKGLIEVGTEMLPLGVFDKVGGILKGMSVQKQNAILAIAGQRMLQAGVSITANGLTNAIEETAAQFGGNVLDKYFQGKDINLMDKVGEAAVVGAVTGNAMALPQVAGVLSGRSEPRNIAAREFAATLNNSDFNPDGINAAVLDVMRTDGVSAAVNPASTKLAPVSVDPIADIVRERSGKPTAEWLTETAGRTEPTLPGGVVSDTGVGSSGRIEPTLTSFTPADSVSAQAGLAPIVVPVPTAVKTTEVPQVNPDTERAFGFDQLRMRGTNVSTGSDVGATAGVGSIAGSDQPGRSLGISGPNISDAARVQPTNAGTAAVNAGSDLVARGKAGEQAAGITPQQNNNAVVEPAKQWFGRKGDGYVTEGDAQQALPGRARMFPELNWSVERMPDGKYRLSGYDATTKAVAGTASSQAIEEAPQVQQQEATSASSNIAPRVDSIERLSVGIGSIKPRVIAENKPLYRETNVDGVSDLLREDKQFSPANSFVTDNKDLALGQGTNKGVMIEFRANALSGVENAKPMPGELTGREYKADLLAPRAIQSITFTDAKQLKAVRGITARSLTQEFDRSTNEAGQIVFTRKAEFTQPQETSNGTQTAQAQQAEAQGQETPVASTRQLDDFLRSQAPLSNADAARLGSNPQSSSLRVDAQQALNNWASNTNETAPQLGTPDADAETTVNVLGNLFGQATGIGQKVVAFNEPNGINGLTIRGTAFVNTAPDTDVAAPRTTLHEIKHVVEGIAAADTRAGRTNTPAQQFTAKIDGIFDEMTDAGKRAYAQNFLHKDELDSISDPAQRETRLQKLLTAPTLRSEMTADFLGNRATDRAFLIDLAKTDPKGFEGFVQKWLSVIDNLIAKLRGSKTQGGKESAKVDQYVRDLNKAKMIARDALVQFRKGNLGEVQVDTKNQMESEPVMSAKQTEDGRVGKVGTHVLNAVRGERETSEKTRMSAEEKLKVKIAAKKMKVPASEVEEMVRDHKSAHPVADGWAPLIFTGAKVNEDTGKADLEYKTVPYEFSNGSDGKSLKPGTAEYDSKVASMAKAMLSEVRAVFQRAQDGDKAAKNIIAQSGWYKEMRTRLRQEFGGLGDLFADLLGATSPNTPVRTNWDNSVEALRLASSGEYDQLMPKWVAWSEGVDQVDTEFRAFFDQQIKAGLTKKAIAALPEYADLKARAAAARNFPDELLPLKANGKKFGFNGQNVVRAMVDLWRVVKNADPDISRGGTAPKAINFSGNLIGFRARATIDVWAARMLQRLAGGLRIPSMAEGGVSGNALEDGSNTLQFGFGQDVFGKAAELIRRDEELSADPVLKSINDDDLQALVWFIEKEVWTKGNWTSAAGEGGSFEFESDLAGVADRDAVRDLRKVADSSVASTADQREQAKADIASGKEAMDAMPAIAEAQRVLDTNADKITASKAAGKEGKLSKDELAQIKTENAEARAVQKKARASKDYKALQSKVNKAKALLKKPTLEESQARRAGAVTELGKMSRTVDRFVAGVSLQQGAEQGVESTEPTDAEMAEFASNVEDAVVAGDPGATIIGLKAIATQGRYGAPERALDLEAIVRDGFDARPLAAAVFQGAMDANQDAAFVARVLRPDEQFDPEMHRPGIEIYFRDMKQAEAAAKMMGAIQQQRVQKSSDVGPSYFSIGGYTIVVDGRRTAASKAGKMGVPVGMRIIYMPEFEARYGADPRLSEGQDYNIRDIIKERADDLVNFADAVLQKFDGVSFAGRFNYEVESRFAGEYQGAIDGYTNTAAAGRDSQNGSSAWKGRSNRESIEAATGRLPVNGSEQGAELPGGDRAGSGVQFSRKQRDRAGRDQGRSIAPLAGAPVIQGATGPDSRLVEVAEQYARDNGIDLRRQAEYVQVDPVRARRIANAYEVMRHAPQDQKVKEAYENLARQTMAQYRALESAGYKFYFFDETNDPYQGNPWNAMRELRNDQVMGVFATEAGFGSNEAEAGNVMLQDTGIKWPYGSVDGKPKRVLANDLFRAVHDAFGHGLEGSGFREQGEENAWQAHVRLFTGSAVGAITSETRGQNSWLNYGPYGEKNRMAKVEDTVFADQKTGLMPEWTWNEGRADDMPAFSKKQEDTSPFYSQLARAIEGVPERLATQPAAQWKAWLASNASKLQIKKEEIEWTGVNDYLDLRGKDKVTKADIAEYLNANGVQIEEVMKGEPSGRQEEYNNRRKEIEDLRDRGGRISSDEAKRRLDKLRGELGFDEYGKPLTQTKYASYQLPGSANYRELLLTLPTKIDTDGYKVTGFGNQWFLRAPDGSIIEAFGTKEGAESKLQMRAADRQEGVYRSQHWDEFNILAHIRFNDRTDADGNKVLFIEELQSDWAQDGRKKGFELTAEQKAAKAEEITKLQLEINELRDRGLKAPQIGTPISEVDPNFLRVQELIRQRDLLQEGSSANSIPAAPFVTKTEGWLSLGIKRMIAYAAENGYDKVAFVNGQQSADRYDLSKQVDSIAATRMKDATYTLLIERGDGGDPINRKNVSESDLENLVGKEVAQKIISETSGDKKSTYLEGLDLKVGGKGMIDFYDKIVPQTVSDVLKKLGGGKVETTQLATTDNRTAVVRRNGSYSVLNLYASMGAENEYTGTYVTRAEAEEAMNAMGMTGQPSFTITDSMREKVGEGLPMFSKKQADTPEFEQWFGDSKVVKEDGTPMVVYHGARPGVDISSFKSRSDLDGVYFTPDASYAEGFVNDLTGNTGAEGAIYPAYLSIQNPYEVTAEIDSEEWNNFVDRGLNRAELKKQGYDGAVLRDAATGEVDQIIAFEPTQIKSATGNSGAFDPATSDIRFSNRQRDSWFLGRDELGRINLGAGAKAYRLAADVASNVLDRVGMKPISTDLGRAMRKMKTEISQARELTAGVATNLSQLSDEERSQISDVIEGELKRGVKPVKRVLEVAASMQSIMSEQTEELVRLNMLTQDAANRWDGKYLPRFYESKLKNEGKEWLMAAKRLLGRTKTMQGIKGSSLKGRGIFQTVPVEELEMWLAQGFEERDPNFDPATDTEITVWRDYSRGERENMGEIRDAMFRFVMGYTKTQQDIALGRLYENLADTVASKSEKPGYVQVPKTNIEDTIARRYGKLGGKWVPKEVLDHLSAFDSTQQNELLKFYMKAMSKWKEGKTVLNPVSHANNVLSNVTMAHFAGVSYWDVQKYLGATRDLVKNTDSVKEAQKAGLFGGGMTQADLVGMLPDQLKVMAAKTESKAGQIGESVWNAMSFWLRKPLAKAYEGEDMFFRYVIYKDARDRGLNVDDAIDHAQKYIFTYDDLPKGARRVRDLALPFFAYTYKVVPTMAETALTYPWRYAAPAAALYAANAAMYAIAAGGDDDDEDWMELIKRYVTDEEFRKKAQAIEVDERVNLPPWMKGASLTLGTSKAIRLGVDELTDLPVFLDVSRIFPGGDLFDAHNNAGGIPLLAPITPNNPILTAASAMLYNKDTFRGTEVVKKSDTDEEAAAKRAKWIYQQMAPALAIGNSHFDRAMNVIANITGEPLNLGFAEYTGIDNQGLPVQPKYAAMQTVGIKARPVDLEASADIQESQQKGLIKEVEAEMRRNKRLEDKNAITSNQADDIREKLIEKRQRLREGLTVDGEERE